MSLGSFAVRAIAAYNWLRYLHVRIEGREFLPASGAALVAARHYHHLFDGAILVHGLPRQPHLFVALDWARTPWERFVMETACALADWPVALRGDGLRPGGAFAPREAARYVRRSLERGAAILRRGDVLAVFPEGYPTIDPVRSHKSSDDAFLPFRAGMLAIVARAEAAGASPVPIVPAGFAYVRSARGFDVILRLGAPLHLASAPSRGALLRELETRVRALSLR